MAKKIISDVLIKFKGDHKGLDNSIRGSRSALSKFSSSARSAAGALVKIGAVGAVAMAGLTFAAWKVTSSFADTGEQIDKVMKITGMGAESIAGLTYAADQEHISLATLEKGWKRLSKAMVDADDGLTESIRTFDGIGVSIYDVDGKLKSVEQMTYEMADAFSALSDDTMKAGLAQDLFGRGGIDMIPFLEMGSKGIKELKEEYKSLGFVWTDDMAKAAKVFKDKLTLLEYGFKAVKLSIGQDLMPEFEKIITWMSTNKDWMVSTVSDMFGGFEIGDIGTTITDSLENIKTWLDDVGTDGRTNAEHLGAAFANVAASLKAITSDTASTFVSMIELLGGQKGLTAAENLENISYSLRKMTGGAEEMAISGTDVTAARGQIDTELALRQGELDPWAMSGAILRHPFKTMVMGQPPEELMYNKELADIPSGQLMQTLQPGKYGYMPPTNQQDIYLTVNLGNETIDSRVLHGVNNATIAGT